MDVIGIDPGNDTGWAVANKGRLLSCGLLRVDSSKTIDINDVLEHLDCGKKLVVIEKPVYRQSNNVVDVNDLISLALKVGRFLELFRFSDNSTVRLITPSDWKGSTPKRISKLRTIEALTRDEHRNLAPCLQKVSAATEHNVWDAIGITLWALKKEGLR